MELKSPVRTGRPRGFDREQAVEAAMTLFWRHGYEGVSVTDLTEAIGVAAPSLYSAFGSKAGLYREALQRYQQRPSAMAGVLAGPGPLKDVVAQLLRAAVRAVTEPDQPHGCMVSSGMFACADANQREAEATAELRRTFLSQLQARIQHAKSEGQLPASASPTGLARYLAAVLQGISMQARDGATARELDVIVQQVLKTWPT